MNINWNDPNFQGFGHQSRPKRERKPVGTPLGRTLQNIAETVVQAGAWVGNLINGHGCKTEIMHINFTTIY